MRDIATDVVDIVDNRLGQMAYDNQFFPKIALQAAQTVLMAPGWLIGGVRTATGGIADLRRLVKPEQLVGPVSKHGQAAGAPPGSKPRLTNRVTGFLTLAIIVSSMNAVLQYLMTGKGPDENKDYFFPKTGRRNSDDSPERLQLPTYWMDHYKLTHKPVETMIHKLNPTWEMLWELYHNEDYYSTEIVDRDQALKDQAEDTAKYITSGYIPFSVTNAQRLADKDVGLGRHVASAFGVNPAPMDISRSEFQKYVMDKTAGHAPKEPKSKSEAEFKQTMHGIEDQLRKGEKPDMAGMTAKDKHRAVVAARADVPQNSFKALSFEDKIHAFALATTKGRERYHLIELLKGATPETSAAFLRKPLAERKDLLDRRRALLRSRGAMDRSFVQLHRHEGSLARPDATEGGSSVSPVRAPGRRHAAVPADRRRCNRRRHAGALAPPAGGRQRMPAGRA